MIAQHFNPYKHSKKLILALIACFALGGVAPQALAASSSTRIAHFASFGASVNPTTLNTGDTVAIVGHSYTSTHCSNIIPLVIWTRAFLFSEDGEISIQLGFQSMGGAFRRPARMIINPIIPDTIESGSYIIRVETHIRYTGRHSRLLAARHPFMRLHFPVEISANGRAPEVDIELAL